MNLILDYPHNSEEGFKHDNLQVIPTKNNQPSGYLLIAMVRSVMSAARTTALDRYVCFTNYAGDKVWIERLSILNPRKWFAFEDTLKIDNNEEFNEVLNFLKQKKILE